MGAGGDTSRVWLGKRLPRYTSYPTAPIFEVSEPREYRDWLAEIDGPKAVSLYLHIPFCRALCWFCGCTMRVTNSYAPVSRYLQVLGCEIDTVAKQLGDQAVVTQIHFGGGSPSILRPEDFTALMATIRAAFNLGADASIAIEIDPRTVDGEKIAAYAKAGVDRVSLGVQDFDDKVQQAVNRVQPYEVVAETVDTLRRHGISRINLDLMYGLPHQTLEGVCETARRALELKPSRIALFGYAHVPWAKPHQRLIADDSLADDVERLQMHRAMEEVFLDAGFVAVGMDHFAAADDDLAVAMGEAGVHRNFQGYTCDNADLLIGLGVSAISKLPQGYAQNTSEIKAYATAVGKDGLATHRGHALSADDKLFGEVIERLMSDLAVSLDGIARRHGRDLSVFGDSLAKLAPLVAAGVVDIDNGVIKLTSPHKAAVRAVAACFDQYIQSSAAKYSRVA